MAALPEISAATQDGSIIHVSDFRSRKNVVLIFSGQQSDSGMQELIRALASRYSEVQKENAEIVLITPSILDWLRFIEIQCPECGVPEWPRTGS